MNNPNDYFIQYFKPSVFLIKFVIKKIVGNIVFNRIIINNDTLFHKWCFIPPCPALQ